jgi:hypothetical protein
VSTDPSVFISYRRQGTAMHAGRLYDGVADRFGEQAVFMDLELAPGIDFVERITTVVGACRALLVVIGPEWAGDGSGSSRLADPNDFVRLEVETALRSPKVRVIPVLVAGARMPAAEQLPPELRPLVRRNAVELTDLKWRYDCTRLMAALEQLLAEAETVAPPASAAPASQRRSKQRRPKPRRSAAPGSGALAASLRTLLPLWAEGVAVAVLAGMLTRSQVDPNPEFPASDLDVLLPLVERRAAAWAVIGAAIAIWLCVRRREYDLLLRRTVMGVLLGGLGGALGGMIFGLLAYVPDTPLTMARAELLAIPAMTATGGIVGATIGALWTPRRIVVGSVSGALGGALVTLVKNGFGHPTDVPALGWDCFAIVGVTLLAMMVLDVRAAAAVSPAGEAAPQAAGA